MSFTMAEELWSAGVCVNAFAPVALTDLVKSQLSQAALDALSARGFPSVEQCAQEAMPLVAEDAPTGKLVIMHLGDERVEVVSDFVNSRSRVQSPVAQR
jgi:NAD(P)-dependent dehydrogenase (short-subunit alcohol dehydrogenase family)